MLRKIERCEWRLVGVGMGAMILAGIVKALLIVYDKVPFNADEAVVALMARHILQGARPVFFYGQAYMGSLDAWLVAAGFGLLGMKVWVIRLVQTLLYLMTLATTAWLGKLVSGKWQAGVIAVCMLAIPAVNVTLYTTASLGGYGEALLFGNLILITTLRIAKEFRYSKFPPAWYCLSWGILVGLGLWAFGITLVFSIPATIFLVRLVWIKYKSRQGVFSWEKLVRVGGWALLGCLIGAAPWWSYALVNGTSRLLSELLGGAITGVEGLTWLAQLGQHTINLVLLGSAVILGFRPPWSMTWLGLPLLPFVLFFWISVIIFVIRRHASNSDPDGHTELLAGVILTLVLGFVLSPFGADPSGRYFLPLSVPLSILAAQMVLSWRERLGRIAYAAIGLIIIYNFWGNFQSAMRYPPGITTQFDAATQIDHRKIGNLMFFLKEQGVTRGYTNYWISYPLAFLSGEELIFIPRLPYHPDFRYTARDDRYPAYDRMVEETDKVAYITANQPDFDNYLRMQLISKEITWEEKQIGDYLVFYKLSKLVSPTEISLGITNP